MRLEDAWIPIDEVAGTAVDTFSYCVERGDGAFYPTKVGKMFAVEDGKPRSEQNYVWRAAACMLSLMERGLDPLRVLVDRAHEHGLDFIANLRLQRLGGVYPELEIENGGAGWAEERVRDLKYDVLRELVTEYPIQGVELDFTAAFSERGVLLLQRRRDSRKHGGHDRVGAAISGDGALAAWRAGLGGRADLSHGEGQPRAGASM